jgi:hypothetical protein
VKITSDNLGGHLADKFSRALIGSLSGNLSDNLGGNLGGDLGGNLSENLTGNPGDNSSGIRGGDMTGAPGCTHSDLGLRPNVRGYPALPPPQVQHAQHPVARLQRCSCLKMPAWHGHYATAPTVARHPHPEERRQY